MEGGEPGTSLLERRVVPQEVPSWAAVAEQVPVPWLEVPPERSRRPGVDEQGCGFRYENGGGNSARLGAYRENSELEGLFAFSVGRVPAWRTLRQLRRQPERATGH